MKPVRRILCQYRMQCKVTRLKTQKHSQKHLLGKQLVLLAEVGPAFTEQRHRDAARANSSETHVPSLSIGSSAYHSSAPPSSAPEPLTEVCYEKAASQLEASVVPAETPREANNPQLVPGFGIADEAPSFSGHCGTFWLPDHPKEHMVLQTSTPHPLINDRI